MKTLQWLTTDVSIKNLLSFNNCHFKIDASTVQQLMMNVQIKQSDSHK